MSIYDYSLKSLAGEDLPLQGFSGKALLIVNVASKCGLTPQYAGLQRIYEKYQAQGFEVLGVPCNQFAGQEPGSAEQIQNFCSVSYGVSFPLSEKIEVNGEGRHPLYNYLCAQEVGPEEAGDIKWNFGKFLIGRDGQVVGRFNPKVGPEDEELIQAIEKIV